MNELAKFKPLIIQRMTSCIFIKCPPSSITSSSLQPWNLRYRHTIKQLLSDYGGQSFKDFIGFSFENTYFQLIYLNRFIDQPWTPLRFLWTISNVLIWAKNVRFKRQVYLTQCIYKKYNRFKTNSFMTGKNFDKTIDLLKNDVAETGFGLIWISYCYVHCKTLRYVLWVQLRLSLCKNTLFLVLVLFSNDNTISIKIPYIGILCYG